MSGLLGDWESISNLPLREFLNRASGLWERLDGDNTGINGATVDLVRLITTLHQHFEKAGLSLKASPAKFRQFEKKVRSLLSWVGSQSGIDWQKGETDHTTSETLNDEYLLNWALSHRDREFYLDWPLGNVLNEGGISRNTPIPSPTPLSSTL